MRLGRLRCSEPVNTLAEKHFTGSKAASGARGQLEVEAEAGLGRHGEAIVERVAGEEVVLGAHVQQRDEAGRAWDKRGPQAHVGPQGAAAQEEPSLQLDGRVEQWWGG